jgi:proton glutamate symport protein
MTFAKTVKHPLTLLASIGLGVLFGLNFKGLAVALGSIGDAYLSFFQMTVIPIVITAIVSSLGKLMKDKSAEKYIVRIILMFVLVIGLAALAGTALGLVGRPGADLGDATTTLNKIIKTSSQDQNQQMALKGADTDSSGPKSSLLDFLLHIIPSNIFSSLSSGRILEIVFFSIIFGIAVGFVRDSASTFLLDLAGSLLESFQKLINWTMYGLPFGLFFLIGKQIAQVGADIFLAMIKFIVIFYAGGLAVFLVCTAVIWIRSRERNPLKVLKALVDPIVISLATRNSFAALPSSISSLNRLRFDENTTNLVLPLGITILRIGNILYFAFAACFVAQIYGAHLSAQGILLVVVGALFAGTATAGSSGLLTLPMLGIILDPLGLPLESILVVFMAIDSLIDPMRTFLIVYGNITTTVLIADRGEAGGAGAVGAGEAAEA